MRRSFSVMIALCSSSILASCAVDPGNIDPIVTSFNESSVEIQLNGNQLQFADEATRAVANAKADAKAAEICARGPNRRAEYASERRVPTGQYTFVIKRLYLCLSEQ